MFSRLAEINEQDECIIGLGRQILIPALVFDVIVNIYLTVLFINPIRKLQSFNNRGNPALRAMAVRTFQGMILTLVATCINIVAMAIMNGERGWLCILLCNIDSTPSQSLLPDISLLTSSSHGVYCQSALRQLQG